MQRMLSVVLSGFALATAATPVRSACCYFSAKDKDILQPAQKVFTTWNPEEKGGSRSWCSRSSRVMLNDFGMVIPTPSQAQARRDAQ